MSQRRLVQKLGIKQGMRLLVQDAPPGYVDLLAPLPDEVEVISGGVERVVFLQLFLRNVHELEVLTPKELAMCGDDRLLWITYQKQSSGAASGLSRDLIRKSLKRLGWRAVTIVAVDVTWAALRFRAL